MARKTLVTPRGRAVYPHLNKPDTRFDENGVYSTKLNIVHDEALPLVQQIDAGMASALETARNEQEDPKKRSRIKQADAPYQEEEDGSFTFNFKMKASGIRKKDGSKWEMQPAIFDAKGKAVPANTLRIGGGSILRVSFEMSEFYTALVGAGVSLRLRGVQVIELVEWGQDASQHGFDSEDGGFEFEGATGVGSTTTGGAPTNEADEDTDEDEGDLDSDF